MSTETEQKAAAVDGLDDGEEEIERVRRARHRISERFGHDPYRLVAHYLERQKNRRDPLAQVPVGAD